MSSFDNLAALVYLKSKARKWKNISFLVAFISLLLAIKMISGDSLSEGLEGDYIASVKIEGIIFEDDFRSETLEKIAEDKSIKAVIINVDSPGGGIVGSEILFDNLRDIAANKPIVVIMGSLAASGGYMAAVASDYIIAHNGTLTGSVGVIMESPEVTDLASKIGIKFNTYKSSPLKGSPSPFEKSNPLVDKVIHESITDSYNFFADLVKERRGEKLNKKLGSKILDGRVFTGRQALEAGLIDEIGGKEEALSYLAGQKIDVKKLAIKEISVEKEEGKFLDKIFGMIPFLDGVNSKNSSHQIMAIIK